MQTSKFENSEKRASPTMWYQIIMKTSATWLLKIGLCSGAPDYIFPYFEDESYTTQKISAFGVILIRIFPHSDWTRRDTEYLSVFSPNARKYGPEKLRIRTLYAVLGSRKCHFDWLVSLAVTVNKFFLAQTPDFQKYLQKTSQWRFVCQKNVEGGSKQRLTRIDEKKATLLYNLELK